MVGAILWPIRVPCQAQYLDAVQLALESIDEAQRIISQTSGMKIVYTAEEMEQVHSEGKIGVLIGIEGGHLLGSSVAVLRMFYTLGARFISLTSYECSNPWVAAHTTKDQLIEEEDAPKYLTEFGKVRIEEIKKSLLVMPTLDCPRSRWRIRILKSFNSQLRKQKKFCFRLFRRSCGGDC